MFTGCVDHSGHLVKIENLASGKRFHIASQFTDLVLGESVCVNGVCLSVTQTYGDEFTADVSPETVALTHFDSIVNGSLVNLERSMRLNDRLNGHFVMGHVDGVAVLETKIPHDGFMEYHFQVKDSKAKDYLVTKGSIAVNGVSLTLNKVHQFGFSVMLIPETLARTNLSALNCQDYVNIEYDYLAKLIVNKQCRVD